MEMNTNDVDANIQNLEEHVFDDIVRARTSFSIFVGFIGNLNKKLSAHYQNRFYPLTRSIQAAAIDSTISALGRLLQKNARENEATLLKYRGAVKNNLHNGHKPPNDCSNESIDKLLNDKIFNKKYSSQLKEFQEIVMDWRDKILAHKEMNIDWVNFPKLDRLEEIISFVENAHRVCRSAHDSAGLSGKYINSQFESISGELIGIIAGSGEEKGSKGT